MRTTKQVKMSTQNNERDREPDHTIPQPDSDNPEVYGENPQQREGHDYMGITTPDNSIGDYIYYDTTDCS